MKNFFLDLEDLNSYTNEELLQYIKAFVPQLVATAWYDCLRKLHLLNPKDRIEAIYETALKVRLRQNEK